MSEKNEGLLLIKERVGHILKFECGTSFGDDEISEVEFHPASGALRINGSDAREIGRGSYGCAYRVFSKKLQKDVVLKVSLFSQMTGWWSGEWSSDILYYESLWKGITGPVCPLEFTNLVRIFSYGDIHRDPMGSGLFGVGLSVSECCELGSLSAMPRDVARAILSMECNVCGLFETLRRLENLQSGEDSGEKSFCQLLNLDLKPSNLLVAMDVAGVPIIKIGDWSTAVALSRTRMEGEEGFIRPSSAFPESRSDLAEGLGGIGQGTMAYKAPETIRNDVSIDSRKIDMFSLGLTLFEVFTCGGLWFEEPEVATWPGSPGFKILFCVSEGESGLAKWDAFVRAKVEKAIGEGLDQTVGELIMQCCTLNAPLRLTPAAAIAHMAKKKFWLGKSEEERHNTLEKEMAVAENLLAKWKSPLEKTDQEKATALGMAANALGGSITTGVSPKSKS
ncbi:MAG: hypothetical protein LBU15_04730 [Rickettsiales bacterium]|jgi:serine/threonine protein kinase|nr:hypothetical protein [Rickettsiales bacterium]